jgi:NAD(P)-dependent dehydrogenase (short-subunit alcohol dehydrogenase family)
VKQGITVNAVAPSLTETDVMRGRTDLARNIPLGRMGQATEVAHAVTMVLGNESSMAAWRSFESFAPCESFGDGEALTFAHGSSPKGSVSLDR